MNVARVALVSVLSLAACSRGASRAAAPTRTAPAQAPAAPPAQTPLALEDDGDEAAIMNAARDVSRYPDTDDGLRRFVTHCAHEAGRRDARGIEACRHELSPDLARVEMALTFAAGRQHGRALVDRIEGTREVMLQRLGGLREPLSVTVQSALGAAVGGPSAAGLDPRMNTLKAQLRPTVRFSRAVLRDAAGAELVLEPVAFLGGHWCWLGPVLDLAGAAEGAPPTRR